MSFDRARNRARYGLSGNASDAVQEDVSAFSMTSEWVHYAIVHTQEPARASIYRDGVVVKSADVPYAWSNNDVLSCMVGNNFDQNPAFFGDVAQVYYWQGALTQKELLSTRNTGSPQHTSATTRVMSVLSQCSDMDECALGTHACSDAYECKNTIGAYVCVNASASTADYVLQDVDECALGTSTCAGNSTCVNTLGSFVCLCSSGNTYNVSFPGVSLPMYDTRLGSDALAVTMWMRTDYYTNNAAKAQALIECINPVTSALYFTVAYSSDANTFSYVVDGLEVKSSSSSSSSAITGANAKNWRHYALVHDAGNVSMYVDGVNVVSAVISYPFRKVGKMRCTIGGSATGDYMSFSGRMQGVYVWARAVDVREVRFCVSFCCVQVFVVTF